MWTVFLNHAFFRRHTYSHVSLQKTIAQQQQQLSAVHKLFNSERRRSKDLQTQLTEKTKQITQLQLELQQHTSKSSLPLLSTLPLPPLPPPPPPVPITVTKGKSFDDNIRKVCYTMLNHETPTSAVRPSIEAVMTHVTGQTLNKLPSDSTVKNCIPEMHQLTLLQLGEEWDKARQQSTISDFATLQHDGTSLNGNVEERIAHAFPSTSERPNIQSFLTAITPKSTGTADSVVEVHTDTLTLLSNVCHLMGLESPTEHNFGNSMSDHASTPKLAAKLLLQKNPELLDFGCAMHKGTNFMSDMCDALKESRPTEYVGGLQLSMLVAKLLTVTDKVYNLGNKFSAWREKCLQKASVDWKMNRIKGTKYFGKVENCVMLWIYWESIISFLGTVIDSKDQLNKLLQMVPEQMVEYNKLECVVISLFVEYLSSTFYYAKTKHIDKTIKATRAVLEYNQFYQTVNQCLQKWCTQPMLLLKGDNTLWKLVHPKHETDSLVQICIILTFQLNRHNKYIL